MSNSKLVEYVKISPHKTSPRKQKIDKITIHHMAGNISIETCGNVFQTRKASANYGIGSDGRVAMYVEEADRSWASSNAANDNRAVTIEVANSGGSPNWPVSDKALAKLIDLCVDICQRNGIEKLNFTGDKNGNLTMHSYFAATACPGPYLKSKFQYIADEVNKRLEGKDKPESNETMYRIRKSWEDAASQVGAYKSLDNAKSACPEGYTVYDESGKAVYSKAAETAEVKVEYAASFNKAKAGTYHVRAEGGLHLRSGASTGKTIIETIPNGSMVECYGYFTGEWLYVITSTGAKGFCHSDYLVKV